MLQLLAPSSSGWVYSCVLRARAAVDPAALSRALGAVVARHPALRTSFGQKAGLPFQRVRQEGFFEYRERDATTLSAAALDEAIAAEALLPFDLGGGPVLRAVLFKRPGERHALLLSMHHLVIDAPSHAIVLADLAALYHAERTGSPARLPPDSLPFADYVQGEQAYLASADAEESWQYWNEQLGSAPPVLNLRTDFPRPKVLVPRPGDIHFQVGAERSQRVLAFNRTHGMTPSTVLLTAYALLLHRWSSQRDLLLGMPVSPRPPGFERTVGYFINLLPIRSKIRPGLTVRTLLDELQASLLDGLDHCGFPFSLLTQRLKVPRDTSRSRLIQATHNHQRGSRALPQPPPDASSVALDAEVDFPGEAVTYQDVELFTVEEGDALVGHVLFNAALFSSETIHRAIAQLLALIDAVTGAPERDVEGLLSSEAPP